MKTVSLGRRWRKEKVISKTEFRNIEDETKERLSVKKKLDSTRSI